MELGEVDKKINEVNSLSKFKNKLGNKKQKVVYSSNENRYRLTESVEKLIQKLGL